MTRFVLAWEKHTWRPGQVEIEVVQRDSLIAVNWPADVDILVMNPPFKSWLRMKPEEREASAQILGVSYRPNLAMAFAHLALGVLREGGTLAMITPNSLFEASSGTSVRAALAEVLTPQLIARLGEQSIFARALVDAGIYVGKRRAPDAVPTAILWQIEDGSKIVSKYFGKSRCFAFDQKGDFVVVVGIGRSRLRMKPLKNLS